ncbi:acetyltransferase [Desulfobulbus alkaliphilus]|uniref:acetyltransferase n=1 Tax=Desulfobulbus alkaliphilus TaxID=869814 RepID=UPI001965119C|nr:acetyltransferase [Desulfobulbus alkaliphilus]MBM9538613.1 acetyltransferase [Desulfobulbus alkaliphilus]
MKAPLFAVYGANGFGREVMPLAKGQLQRQGIGADRLVFVDDNPPAEVVNGQQVLSYGAFLDIAADERHAVLAIANSTVRERIAARCQADGVRPWTVRAANTVVLDGVALGEGAILCPFVTLTANIRIGRQFHANLYSYVAHDCHIGDFVTFAPRVCCNGNVTIEDHVYIGTGAVIKQGQPGRPLVIGRGAVVGMGAVVTRDVPPCVTVVGNPARPLVKSKQC